MFRATFGRDLPCRAYNAIEKARPVLLCNVVRTYISVAEKMNDAYAKAHRTLLGMLLSHWGFFLKVKSVMTVNKNVQDKESVIFPPFHSPTTVTVGIYFFLQHVPKLLISFVSHPSLGKPADRAQYYVDSFLPWGFVKDIVWLSSPKSDN